MLGDAVAVRPFARSAATRPVSDTQPRRRTVDLLFGALVLGYAAVWAVVARWLDVSATIQPGLPGLYFTVFPFLFVWYSAIAALVYRARVRNGAAEWKPRELRQRGLSALWIFIAIAAMGTVFTSAKIAIPEIVPFRWDAALADADAFLHGGVQPWRLLQPVLGWPPITVALGLIYSPVWFGVVGAFLGWIAWHGDQRLRLRFLIAWTLTWIVLGNVAATALSSAGPVYFANVVPGVDPFAPLFEYLSGAAPGLTAAQHNLWAAQMGTDTATATALGISAAPSLHVAIPALFSMIMWRHDRRWSLALWAYTFVQFIATVHLGWHYAIDGYMGIAGAGALLWCTDRVLGWTGSPRATLSENYGGTA